MLHSHFPPFRTAPSAYSRFSTPSYQLPFHPAPPTRVSLTTLPKNLSFDVKFYAFVGFLLLFFQSPSELRSNAFWNSRLIGHVKNFREFESSSNGLLVIAVDASIIQRPKILGGVFMLVNIATEIFCLDLASSGKLLCMIFFIRDSENPPSDSTCETNNSSVSPCRTNFSRIRKHWS